MNVNKEQIRGILAEILFLDDAAAVQDETKIFTELSLSSIDFIDLVFELRKLGDAGLKAETLWPFPKMLLDDRYYGGGAWTDGGLARIQEYTGVPVRKETTLKDLYPHFTLNYIERLLNRVPEPV